MRELETEIPLEAELLELAVIAEGRVLPQDRWPWLVDL